MAPGIGRPRPQSHESHTAYRIILVRPEEQPVIFKVLSVVLVLLFALALYWAVRFDLMKREWA